MIAKMILGIAAVVVAVNEERGVVRKCYTIVG